MLMRRIGAIVILATLLLLLKVPASEGRGGGGHHGGAHGRSHFHGGRVFVGVGPWWWGPAYPYWYYPPPGYYDSPSVVVEEAPVYIERSPMTHPEGYWYYCPSAKAYYPQVPNCQEPWVPVPPTTN
jgi:hypothetical protein